MHDIDLWLQNGTYADGVKLYARYGGNEFLKKKFAVTHDDYTARKLRTELEKLAPKKTASKAPAPVARIPEPEVQPAAANPNPAEAKEYIALLKQRDRLYREIDVLMAGRHHLPEGEELKQCARTILLRNRTLTEIWEKIDYYTAHGQFEPVVVAPAIPDKEASRDNLQLLRQTISKAQARLASGKCRNVAQTEKLLNDAIEKRDAMLAKIKQA